MITKELNPSIIEIQSLGIGLLNYSNINKLDLEIDEFMVVGEQYSVSNTTQDIKYSLLVNKDCVAINSTRRQINTIQDNNVIKGAGLYVDNDIICSGSIIANGLEFADIKFDNVNSNLLEDIFKSINNINPLFFRGHTGIKVINDEQSTSLIDNIYSTAYLTVGTGPSDTFNNYHPLNISQRANYNVNNIQLCIHNKITNSVIEELAKLRIGIIGDAPDSPAVFTTTYQMPIHFHVGKTTLEINKLYEDKTGYPNFFINSNILPSLALDNYNCVAIGTTESEIVKYPTYKKISDEIIFKTDITEYSKLRVKGSALFDNILIYDYYTSSNKHLDDIYVRRLGQTFETNQIRPGSFIKGEFRFNSNVYIGNNNDNYVLNVANRILANNINISESADFNNISVNNAIFKESTTFNQNININNDVILGGNIHVNDGDLFISDIRINIAELHPIMVDKNIADASNINGSNVLIYATDNVLNFIDGSNFTIPGRLGIGVLSSDEYNNQLTIIKRNVNNFELMLQDSSEENIKTIIPSVNIGHIYGLNKINNFEDNSFIISTNRLPSEELHNIYFYAGTNDINNNIGNLTPSLTIHQNNNIGINTKTPKYSLDVNGELLCKDIYISKNNEELKALYFIMRRDTTAALGDISRDYYYMYDNTGIDKYCINFADKNNINLKALNVKGGIQLIDGDYYQNNIKIETLKIIDSNNEQIAYTNKHIIIGHKSSNIYLGNNPLSIRNTSSNNYNDTIIRLYRGLQYGGSKTNSIYTGLDICDYDIEYINENRNKYKWFMYKNNLYQGGQSANGGANIGPLQFGYTNGTMYPTHFGMTMYFDTITSNYYTDFNNPIVNNDFRNRNNAVAIYGNLDVYGDINIIGSSNYKKNGIIVSPNAIDLLNNNNILDNNNIENNSETNDVIISGNKIAIIPKKATVIGNSSGSIFLNYINNDNNINNIPLTVYQSKNSYEICKFLSVEDTQNSKNSSSIEIGIIGLDRINNSSVKKNSSSIRVSNYGRNTENELLTLIEIGAYNYQSKLNDKIISIYHDTHNSYVNIGHNNISHDQVSGKLRILDTNNITLHVQNPSKYLLQLTNNTINPAISMHNAIDLDNNKFWILEGPDNKNSLLFRYSENSNNYIPNNNDIKDIISITNDGKLGINVKEPENTIELKNSGNHSAVKLTNRYNNISYSTNYDIIKIVNSNLEFRRLDNNFYIYNNNSRVYNSGIEYNINSNYIPIYNINGEQILYDFIENSNFIKRDIKNIENTFKIEKIENILITSNNEYLNFDSEEYVNTQISLGGGYLNNNLIIATSNYFNILNNFNTPSNVHVSINQSDIRYKNVAIECQIVFPTPNDQTNDTIFTYRYYNNYEIPYSFESVFDKRIVQNGFNMIEIDSTKIDIYTSNVIIVNLSTNANTSYSKISKELIASSRQVRTRLYNNYLITSNVFYYNSNSTYQLNIIAKIDKYYTFNSKIIAPNTIIDSNISNIYTSNVINNNISIYSYTNFLKELPYGLYEEFNFRNNIINHKINEISFTDSQLLYGITYNYSYILYDYYSIYDFISYPNRNIQEFYLNVRMPDYQPHLMLQNTIEFNNGEKQLGKKNEIYSRNGGIEIISIDEEFKNTILNINNSGDINVKGRLILNDGIYDKLGNSLIIDYTKDMYDKAFIMQSSNYILYTSNYNIHSYSNLSFVLEGRSDKGLEIYKKNIYYPNLLNTYDLFKIYDGDYTAFSVIHGGKVGILTNYPEYNLDINGDARVSNIYCTNIYGDGINIHNVNLNDRDTSMLKEGSNLYYTSYRVGVITYASNLNTSNYIVSTSNLLINKIYNTSNDLLNYTNNELYNTSNKIIINLNNSLNDVSNYIQDTTQSIILSQILLTSNNITDYVYTSLDIINTNINDTIYTSINELNNTINTLTTTDIVEGTNKYYTDARFLQNFISKSCDYLNNGTSNKFILYNQENNTSTYGTSSEEIFYLNGTLNVSGGIIGGGQIQVQQVAATSTSTVFIGGEITNNIPSLNIFRPDTSGNLFTIGNYIPGGQSNYNLLTLSGYGNLGIGKYPSDQYKIDANGIINGTYIKGDGSYISKINLEDRNTDLLKEGTSNFYYNKINVGLITESSNLNTSNYIDKLNNILLTSNNNTSNYIKYTGIYSSNYILNVSNQLYDYNKLLDTNTSNYISILKTDIINTGIYSSNYILNVSNILTTQLNYYGQQIQNNDTRILNTNIDTSNYIKNTSNNLFTTYNIANIDTSNYIKNTSNNLSNNLANKFATYNIANNRVLVSDNNGKIASSLITSTELEYISGAGTSKKFIENNIYNNNIIFTNSLNASNIITSNIELYNWSDNSTTFNINHRSSCNIINIENYEKSLLIIDKIGNVGIGTTELVSKLNVNGSISATGDIVSSYSDIRLKKIIGDISQPIDKIMKINTFIYQPNDIALGLNLGQKNKYYIGVSAQDVKDIIPEVISLAPFDSCNLEDGKIVSKSGENYLTVNYERIVPLLIESIKELKRELIELKEKLICNC